MTPWCDHRSAAERANVSVPTVKRAIKRGELRAYKLGRLVRIHIDDIDDWIRTGETPTRIGTISVGKRRA